MLAKIAHSDAVARSNLNAWEPLLIDLILRNDIDPARYVGTLAVDEVPIESMFTFRVVHLSCTIDAIEYLVTKIRLFAGAPSPTYVLLTGRAKASVEPAS